MYKIRSTGGWQNYRMCSLEVSVGKDYHEGRKFEDTCRWAAQRFPQVLVNVGDTLQRHYLPDGCAETARAAGDAWLERNAAALRLLEGRMMLIRWDDWRNHPTYPLARAEIDRRLHVDPVFAQAVTQDLSDFVARNPSLKASACRAFLLEELAVELIFNETYEAVMLYPGGQLHSMALVSNKPFCRLSYRRKAAGSSLAQAVAA
ncbi:MAG: hypothetical protein Q7P63_12250 [Verrucomicrobiota bacterium JB022]|nr:hypothetical protein [Verrucomicrobiota bacterium JB022]